MLRLLPLATLASLLCLLHASTGAAQASLIDGFGGTVDYGTSCLSANDDGSSASIDISSAFPGGLRFFDMTHTSIYVNTNGNISFSDRLSTFTPNAFPVANRPMIAPYWGDVDIRRTGGSCMGSAGVTCTVCSPCHNPSENGVWWHLEPGRLIVTWDRVGYYSCNNDNRMSFQLILTAVEGCGAAGDFDVEFRYNRCEWETGDASGGSGGFGGTEAQAGFDAGNGTDFVEIMGSREAGIANMLCTGSNVGETGIWRFQIRSGTVTCPDAGDACTVAGAQGVCADGLTNCVGAGTECQSVLEPSGERCDALDNDCDGSTDEGDDICPGLETCVDGLCIDVCFEGSCPADEVCSDSGRCVEAACDGIDCPEGQRCVGGSCVGACDGVTCPAGQECRAGRCLDACDSLTCDPECQVCTDGMCVTNCEFAPCGGGETCLADGRCVETACADVTCGAGEYCDGGTCVDACTGAVCPDGQSCMMGECMDIPMTTPDAGPRPGLDAGPGGSTDMGGSTGGPDGGDEGEADGGRVVGDGGDGAGCACRSAGNGASSSLWSLLVLGLIARRRRR